MTVKNDGRFGKHRQPTQRRGKDKSTLILEAIKERALLDVPPNATKDECEKAMFGWMAETAFTPNPEAALQAQACFNALIKRGWPELKSVAPNVEFDFDSSATPTVKANMIMDAIANGEIPPDIGANLISALAAVIKIEEFTDLKAKLEEVERQLGIGE